MGHPKNINNYYRMGIENYYQLKNYNHTIGNDCFSAPNSSPVYTGFPSCFRVFIINHRTPFQAVGATNISTWPHAAASSNLPSSVLVSNNARTKLAALNSKPFGLHSIDISHTLNGARFNRSANCSTGTSAISFIRCRKVSISPCIFAIL